MRPSTIWFLAAFIALICHVVVGDHLTSIAGTTFVSIDNELHAVVIFLLSSARSLAAIGAIGLLLGIGSKFALERSKSRGLRVFDRLVLAFYVATVMFSVVETITPAGVELHRLGGIAIVIQLILFVVMALFHLSLSLAFFIRRRLRGK